MQFTLSYIKLWVAVWILSLSPSSRISAVYLPGNTPKSYRVGDAIPVEANKMSSAKTQVPYSMYTLDFCRPPGDVINTAGKTLGQILGGDVIQNTPFNIRMTVNEECKILCTKSFNSTAIQAFQAMINDEYLINLLADDLPAAWKIDLKPFTSPIVTVSRILQHIQDAIQPPHIPPHNQQQPPHIPQQPPHIPQQPPHIPQQPPHIPQQPPQIPPQNIPPENIPQYPVDFQDIHEDVKPAPAILSVHNLDNNIQQPATADNNDNDDDDDDDTLLPGGFPLGVADHQQQHSNSGSSGGSNGGDEFRRIVSSLLPPIPAGTVLLFNHLDMTVLYHEAAPGEYRVVGFNIRPRSVSESVRGGASSAACGQGKFVEGGGLNLTEVISPATGVVPVTFSYSVNFKHSPISWATRWDAYLASSNGAVSTAIHWFSILNSFLVVVILAGAIGTILLRTVLRDIAQYNALADSEDLVEESAGWKQIHGDVFRRPRFSKLLATCAGTGVQVLIMICLTLAFAVLGLLSPRNRGSIIQVMLVSFAVMGWPAGYVSARFTKLFQATESTTNATRTIDNVTTVPAPHRYFTVTFLTAFLYTGVCFATFLVLNLILSLKGSSGATPFLYLFLLVLLWLGVSVPLVFFGAYSGYRQPVLSVPTRTNQIPRQIPERPWFLRSKILFATGGILPFGAAFSELSFIVASVWQHKFYTLFGFLALVLLILLVTCAETSIVFTYFQLAAEDYRWWWKSFWVSAFSAVYFFAFSVLYFFNALEISSFPSVMLFFGYTGLMTYTFFLVTGAVGFLATFGFVRAIYSAVKVD